MDTSDKNVFSFVNYSHYKYNWATNVFIIYLISDYNSKQW